MSERKIYLLTFLAIIVGMALAMGLVRAFALANNASGKLFLGRELEALEALPRIMEEPGDAVMVFGSSMVEAGFSARQFEREVNARGGKIKAWNFGFGGLNPYFQDFYSRRIVETYQQNDKRLRLVLIEFNPFQTTTTRWDGAREIVDSFMTLLASPEELREIALADPERGALLYNIKYFRDGVSAEMITTFFGQAFQEPPQRSDAPSLDDALQARLDEVNELLDGRFEADYPDWDGSQWYYPWQGSGTIPEERSEETVALIKEFFALQNQDQRRLENDRLNRIRTADILGLEFEELLIAHFINVVENFKQVSDEVEVILLPRNEKWIQYTPEVEARLQGVIDRIARETGVRVVNQQQVEEITPDMFSDTTHLARYAGDVPYTRYLVEQYAERLIKR